MCKSSTYPKVGHNDSPIESYLSKRQTDMKTDRQFVAVLFKRTGLFEPIKVHALR
jgi:hypothetical protein